MNSMNNFMIDPEKFIISDLPQKLAGVEWHALPEDEVNRAGIPSTSDFEEIFELDYICEGLGGVKVAKYRDSFGTGGCPWESAMTAYRVGDALIVNRTGGYQPDRRTTVLTKVGQKPSTRILDRFGNYYNHKEPKIVQAIVNIGINLG